MNACGPLSAHTHSSPSGRTCAHKFILIQGILLCGQNDTVCQAVTGTLSQRNALSPLWACSCLQASVQPCRVLTDRLHGVDVHARSEANTARVHKHSSDQHYTDHSSLLKHLCGVCGNASSWACGCSSLSFRGCSLRYGCALALSIEPPTWQRLQQMMQ